LRAIGITATFGPLPRKMPMRNPPTGWFVALAAISACLFLASVAPAQESPIDDFVSYFGGPPEESEPARALQGCQGSCGWISDDCADSFCVSQKMGCLGDLVLAGRG